MTSLTKAVASALSFAHLAGLGRPQPKAADDGGKDASAKGAAASDDDDPDRKKRDDESDDDYAKRMKKMDDDDDSNASAQGAGAGDGGKDDDKDKDKAAKAGKDDGDDDDDEEMRGKSAAAQARRREQARCAAIFASPAAARNPVLAANLAFKSRMGRTEALAVLEGTPAGAIGGHSRRADGNPRVGAGDPGGMSSTQAVAKSWDTAFAKANPRPAAR